tara:strand:- start:2580 stop:2981 length:402 start_codon:yes stop_codon:yes gene_type:complete
MNILSLKISKRTMWIVATTESGNYAAFDLKISSDAASVFHLKYHDVIDVRKSGTYLLDANKQPYLLEFVINVFVDLLDEGGSRHHILNAKQHGLISLGTGISDRPNALIQIIDISNSKVAFSMTSKGKIGLMI